ncbi:MAG: HEAT repeat domain-containing protein [Planctomycetes bacterium]|nr:HEAT repeat domain-containing protein [Planctomycetota bacterium]
MRRNRLSSSGLLALTLVGATPTFAQKAPAKGAAPQEPAEDPVQIADVKAFSTWLAEYKAGAFRLVKEGRTDEAALTGLDAKMAALAKWNSMAAARMLFEAASVEPRPTGAQSSTDLIDFYRELQPWRVQSLAARHLRSLSCPPLMPWLIGMLSAKGIRAAEKNQDQRNAAAVLRILAGHPSIEARLELLKACRAMPTELRVQAVSAMAQDATLETAPTLVELLRDAEPNVRIAAANALGTAMQPHVDETLGKKPAGELLATRDLVIAKLGELLVRDQIWQVRSAAAFSLAVMRCKPVVPTLIAGLEAELARKKDPWAMDVRLHRLLEGLTGLTVVQGSITPWKDFWQKEGASFAVAPKTEPGKEAPKASKYEKFFNLEIESDRVLFVLDFSGSMAEPVQLLGKTTGAQPGKPTTKAEIVVAELKKLVLSLPDGALINLVVFSDEVRTWREEGGKPALIKLTDDTRDDLLGNFLDSLRPNGPTNLYGALDKALDFGGRGLHDKYYAAGFDTLYVITDGAPTVGEVTDKEEIRRRVRAANQLRKIAIHCVTFGDKNDTDFLKPLAEENGGRHIHIE